jgi:hypothetical protein
MRSINYSAYEKCKSLVEDAKKNLIKVAGPTNAKILIDLSNQVEDNVHGPMFKKVCPCVYQNVCISSVVYVIRKCFYCIFLSKGTHTYTHTHKTTHILSHKHSTFASQAIRSITLLWTLWSSVVGMPRVWLPPYKPFTNFKVHDWELSSSVRQSLLGNSDACMLVTGLVAYSMLPGRTAGIERGSVSSTQLGSIRVIDNDQGSVSLQQHAPQQDMHAQVQVPAQIPGEQHEEEGEGGRLSDTASIAIFGETHSDEANEFEPLPYPNYFTSRHFRRLPRHAPGAWDDCMWLLRLQEGEVQQQQQQPTNRHATVPPAAASTGKGAADAAASTDQRTEVLDNGISEILNMFACPSCRAQPGGKACGRPCSECARMASCTSPRMDGPDDDNGQNTAFAEFETELILLKPFLMYGAVFASSITTTNMYYMEDVLRVVLEDVAVRSGFFEVTPRNADSNKGPGFASGEQDSSLEGAAGSAGEGTAAAEQTPQRTRRRRLF